jgi:hypothetical protein
MSNAREQAHRSIDRLPEAQVSAPVGLLEAIVDPVAAALVRAPIDWLVRHSGNAIPHGEAMLGLGLG